MAQPHIRFGYGFDMRNPAQWERPWADHYAQTLDFISWIDTIGFEGVWFAEHHARTDGYLPSPFVVGAAVAGRTKNLRISTGVALAPHYHPVRLAEDLAIIDIISNGRAEASLGLGYLEDEALGYGFHQKKRGRMTDEILQIMRQLWTGESVTWKSDFFDLQNARITPLPIQKPGVPLFVGAASRAGLRRAARFGDGYIGGPTQYAPYLEEVLACGKAASAARIMGMGALWTVISEDPEKTLREVGPHFYYQINAYAKWQSDKDWAPFDDSDYETFLKGDTIKVLTPDQAIDLIRSMQEMAPIEGFVMQAPAGYPFDKLAESAELFAKKVIPAFR